MFVVEEFHNPLIDDAILEQTNDIILNAQQITRDRIQSILAEMKATLEMFDEE